MRPPPGGGAGRLWGSTPRRQRRSCWGCGETPRHPHTPTPAPFPNPLALGAPQPILDIPFRPSRMIHFLDFSNEKMVAKVPDIAPTVDILLGNLEDAVPVDRKEAARAGLVRVGKDIDLGETQLWTRVNSLESPWVLDDITTIVTDIGHKPD